MAATKVPAVLGTMTWGPTAQVNLAEATKQLEAFVAAGGSMIDTARIYQFGQTEELIGELLANRPDLATRIEIHTKANPLMAKLDASGIASQLDASLKALRVSQVAIFYLHQPDHRVPLVETLKACDDQFRQGKFKEFGLSNYAAWDVVYAHYLCEKHGFAVRPTIYQGVMNAITRSMDGELMPALRSLGMRCYVFNPLAGGLLTGRYKSIDDKIDKGRFSPEFDFVPASMANHPLKGKGHEIYKARYWRPEFFEAVNVVKVACDRSNTPMATAAVGWVLRHSTLKMNKGDGIIFGASSVDQVKSNMKAVNLALHQELPSAIVSALDNASRVIVKHEAYFRGYDANPGSSGAYLAKF